MRISDWSSDVCSSDLIHAKDDQPRFLGPRAAEQVDPQPVAEIDLGVEAARQLDLARLLVDQRDRAGDAVQHLRHDLPEPAISDDDRRAARRIARIVEVGLVGAGRSEEHTSELQSLMRNSYAGFCLKKKNTQ